MIPDNVILIVKAPNQQIEDQNIECLSSWTVRELKGHLSEVYPSKPTTDEQKIIYSGQLLDDNTILKDVLRTYESQIGHTMHLVCTPKWRIPETVPEPPKVSTDGLRQRNVTVEPAETPRPETRQNDQNHTVEMQNYLSSFVNNYGRVPPFPTYNLGEGHLPVPNDPAMLANHMLMMQQAYIQYMQQYANMWQAGAVPAAAPPVETPPQPAPPEAPAQPLDQEEPAHDWLDHLYSASRLAILFSLVYLYGSPARFLLVLLLAAAGYLHQIGFFRDLHLAGNNQREQPEPVNGQPPPQAQNGQPQPQNDQPRPQNDQPQLQNGPNQAGDAPDTPIIVEPDQPSLLSVTWMIFTSFFASLIPETN